MRIIFNLVNCGLANNGGSQSILRMATALRKLDQDAIIITNKEDRFTWFEYDNNMVVHVGEDPSDWPKAEAIIATGCGTVWGTFNYPYLPLRKKFYWIRGFEVWAQPEDELYRGYQSGLTLLVNSEWQKRNIFLKCGILPRIVYPGIPTDDFADCKIKIVEKPIYEKVKIGALYQPNKASKRFDWTLRILSGLRDKEVLKHVALLSDCSVSEDIINFFKKEDIKFIIATQPSFRSKAEFMFNECDIWLATTINDGLHIPPMEAGKCGCNLVTSGYETSGMNDYAIPGVTCNSFLTIDEAIEGVVGFIEDITSQHSFRWNLMHILEIKIGSVKRNASRLLGILS